MKHSDWFLAKNRINLSNAVGIYPALNNCGTIDAHHKQKPVRLRQIKQPR